MSGLFSASVQSVRTGNSERGAWSVFCATILPGLPAIINVEIAMRATARQHRVVRRVPTPL